MRDLELTAEKPKKGHLAIDADEAIKRKIFKDLDHVQNMHKLKPQPNGWETDSFKREREQEILQKVIRYIK
jgi:hypothetical protein